MEDRQANGHPVRLHQDQHGTTSAVDMELVIVTRMVTLSLLSLVRPPKRGLVGLEGGVGHLETTILVILV